MMKTEPVILEKVLDAQVEKVWEALTNNELMKQWYFDIPEFKPEPGFEFTFVGGKEEKYYVHHCRVTDVITGQKLTYSWRYEGYKGNSFVTFELYPEGTKTRLRLIHEGLETFPADNPDLAKENFAEGWTYIIGSSLKEFVEKNKITENL